MPNSDTYLNRTPLFKWCGYKDGHQKDMCLKEIGHTCSKIVDQSRINSQITFLSFFFFGGGGGREHTMALALLTFKYIEDTGVLRKFF